MFSRCSKKTKKVLLGSLTLVLMLGIVVWGGIKNPAKAAALNNISVSLVSNAVSTPSNVTLAFTVNTAFTASTIVTVAYDTAFTGGASLTNSDIAVTGATCTASNFVAGSFRLSCGTASNGAAISVVIGATNKLTTPSTQGNYSFSLVADIGGAGTTYDSGAGLAYIARENEVEVTAVVAPVIDLELYQQNSTSLLANTAPNPNSCALGVLTIATVNTCIYDIGFGTNNSAGMTVRVIADGLLNTAGGADIDNVADGTVSAGSEEYGFRLTDNGTGCGTVTVGGTYGSQDNAVPTTVATLFSNNTVCDGSASVNTTQRAEVTHKASVSAATQVGSYNQLVTYTAFTN